MVMLRTSRNERRHNSTLENSHNNERSSRGISVTDIEDGAIVFAVIWGTSNVNILKKHTIK